MATAPRKFDVKVYKDKALTALQKLKQEQQPGKVQMGTKSEVLASVQKEMRAMLDSGYTADQIAEAFKKDVFEILPKSITSVVKQSSKKSIKSPTDI